MAKKDRASGREGVNTKPVPEWSDEVLAERAEIRRRGRPMTRTPGQAARGQRQAQERFSKTGLPHYWGPFSTRRAWLRERGLGFHASEDSVIPGLILAPGVLAALAIVFVGWWTGRRVG